jgi:1-acyl-sn-glycerol-3-phosphate acyltransferase
MTRSSPRSLPKRLWYRFIRFVSRLAATLLFRVRVTGRNRVPRAGGVMVLSNHQSHFDPVLIGVSCDRHLSYLARETLFRFAPLRWLIGSLDAIPIDREGLGLAGLRETLRRLKNGEMVLIFPEGTRTSDGEMAPLKAGFSSLAKRSRVPLLPIGIEGAYQAWPRWRRFPGFGAIHVYIGHPILPTEAAAFDDRQLVEEVERRIRQCQQAARQSRKTQIGRPRKTPS